MKVKDVMRQPAVVINEETSLEEAAQLMLKHGFRGLPVIDKEGLLCGFVSVSDYLAKEKYLPFSTFHSPQLFGKWVPPEGIEEIYDEARATPVKEIMSKNVICIDENEPVEKLVELMMERGLNRVPVVRDGFPVGIVARYDLLRMMSVPGADPGGTESR